MLSFISALVAPASLPSPRPAAQVPTETGTQLPVARVASRASDGFSTAVGAKEGAAVGALTGAGRNVDEGRSLLRIADAGLGEISDALVRMKELATLPSTTSLSRQDLAIVNAEFEALRTEIDNIVDRTKFNDIKVLEGVSLAFKVGTGNASQDSVTVSLSAATVAGLDASLASDTITGTSSASLALTNVTSAIDALKGIQASVDGAAVRFQTARRNLTSDKHILNTLKSDLLESPVTMGTADYLTNMVSQEFLSQAVPAAAGQLSSATRVLLSTSQVRPIEPSQARVQTPDQEKAQTRADTRPSAYETGQSTKSSSRSDTSRGVDIEA